MVMRRQCAFRMPNGQLCPTAPLKDGQFCWMHSPEHAQEAQEARRLGGLRRKREVVTSSAYDFEGLTTVAGIRRLVEIAVLDTLAMENSMARNRTLAYLAQVALHTLEVGNMEQRIAALEQAVMASRGQPVPSAFDNEPALIEPSEEKGHEPG